MNFKKIHYTIQILLKVFAWINIWPNVIEICDVGQPKLTN